MEEEPTGLTFDDPKRQSLVDNQEPVQVYLDSNGKEVEVDEDGKIIPKKKPKYAVA